MSWVNAVHARPLECGIPVEMPAELIAHHGYTSIAEHTSASTSQFQLQIDMWPLIMIVRAGVADIEFVLSGTELSTGYGVCSARIRAVYCTTDPPFYAMLADCDDARIIGSELASVVASAPSGTNAVLTVTPADIASIQWTAFGFGSWISRGALPPA